MAAIGSHCSFRSEKIPLSAPSSSFSGASIRFPRLPVASSPRFPVIRRSISCQASSGTSLSSSVGGKGECLPFDVY
ncbi:hypothetical protein SLA2020_151670 [Shorea laevis]